MIPVVSGQCFIDVFVKIVMFLILYCHVAL